VKATGNQLLGDLTTNQACRLVAGGLKHYFTHQARYDTIKLGKQHAMYMSQCPTLPRWSGSKGPGGSQKHQIVIPCTLIMMALPGLTVTGSNIC